MPALIAFGRKWQIGSDDFVFPGLIELIFRIAWIVAACIIYLRHEMNFDCRGGEYMKIYLYGTFIILFAITLVDIALIQNSMAGFIMDLQARKHVPFCLYLRLFLEVPEVVWNILGSYWIFSNTINCSQAPQALFLIKGLSIFSWIVIVLMIIIIALVFDPLGSSNVEIEDDYERFERGVIHNKKTLLWERRCRLLMCSCRGNDEMSRGAFKEIGKLMSFLFEDMDLVPSDLAAGLILINLKQRGSQEVLLRAPEEREEELIERNYLIVPNDPWNSTHIIAHFMNYALGSYGWPWFLVANLKMGICRLWENLLCCGCCISHPCDIEGDNCCFCHTSALKHTIKFEEKDLIYASFRNEVYQTPFYIAVDHSTQSIVIAIRGTMSLRDTITDLTAEAMPLDYPGLQPGCKAHNGMLRTAKNVQEKLEELKILQRIKTLHPNYNLVLTGHSLGAGTAAILSLMMRSEYPNIRCYAYSPPGGLMTLEAAQFCESFTTSIILGDDIIGRLSVPSFDKFKNKLENVIKECRTPKYQILVGGCFYFLLGGRPNLTYRSEDEDEGRSNTNLLNNYESEQANYHTYVSLAEVSHRMQREQVTNCPMYPPGKIFHVTESPPIHSRPDLTSSSCKYEFRWADRNEFRDIIVTPTMMLDHYPDNVYRALKDLAASETNPFTL